MTQGRPWRARVWVPVIAVLAMVFGVVIPLVPGLAATTRPVEPGERIAAQTASFEPAQGWTLDLDAAVSSRPEVSQDGTVVRLSDGIWFGSTSSLISRMGELLADGGASVGSLPQAPDDDALITLDPEALPDETIPRAQYLITFTTGDNTGQLFVVREDAGVALMRVVGTPASLDANRAEIDAMVASIDVGVVDVDDVPTEPR